MAKAASQRTSAARLLVRWLVIARVAWPIYVTLLVSIFVAGLQVRYLQLTGPSPAVRVGLEKLSLSTGFYASYNLSLEVIFALVFLGVAALIYARKSDERIGLLMAYTLATFGTAASPIINTMEALADVAPTWAIPVRVLRFLAWTLMLLLFYLFPDGRFMNPR